MNFLTGSIWVKFLIIVGVCLAEESIDAAIIKELDFFKSMDVIENLDTYEMVSDNETFKLEDESNPESNHE